MLPKTQTTYRYDGSLTTPGCAEGVKWNVMSTPISMSAEQIAYLEKWIRDMQIKMGNGFGEGFLINAAAVIWEG